MALDDLKRAAKARQAKELRYKKPRLDELGFDNISAKLDDICEVCEELRWVEDEDLNELTEALDGDEEEAYEFRMAFADLSGEAYQLNQYFYENCYDLLDKDYSKTDFFDDVGVLLLGQIYEMVGYDDFQEDYYRLTSYEEDLAESEAAKRIMRLTKKQMITEIGRVWRIIVSYLNVDFKYQYLKATLDILKGENHAFLETIKSIEKAYNELQDDWDGTKEKAFDRLVSQLPDSVWFD